MRVTGFLILYLCATISVHAQRFNAGIMGGTDVTHQYHYNTNIISPLDIPDFFFVNDPYGSEKKYDYWGIFNNRHGSLTIRIAPMLKISYKAFSLRLSSGFQYSKDKLEFFELFFDGTVSEYLQEFDFHSFTWENQSTFTIDLQKKATAFYLAFAWSHVSPMAYVDERDIYDYQTQTLPYMYSVAYNEFAYQNLKAGIGKKFTRMEFQLMYSRRRDFKTVDLDVVISKLELNCNIFFKAESLRKGHYLYLDE
jgi:hypothetical protein